jgi:hypothetical protein
MSADPVLDRFTPQMRRAWQDVFAASPEAEVYVRLTLLSSNLTQSLLCPAQEQKEVSCDAEREAMNLPLQAIRLIDAMHRDDCRKGPT